MEVPGDLRSAIDASAGVATVWEELPPSAKKAHVTAVFGAKAAETRARRIAAIVANLAG